MSFPTLHPENKALNLLDSAVTLFPQLRPELKKWSEQLAGAIAKPVDPPPGLDDLAGERGEDVVDMNRETYLLARALCQYRTRVYPNGLANPFDPNDEARDDLESAMSRFEERLARSKPKVELDNAPDAGDYYDGPEPGPADAVRLDPTDPGDAGDADDNRDADGASR